MPFRVIQTVASTNIQTVAYDDDKRDLMIRFIKRPQVYIYHDVPSQVAQGFATTNSPGVYFRGSVLNQYSYDQSAGTPG